MSIKVLISTLEKQLSPSRFNYYINFLPEREKNKILRYKRWEDGHSSLLGKLLLMEGLALLGYSKEVVKDLDFTEYHKPFFAKGPEFNISHSGNYIICAISDQGKIGADIEKIVNLDFVDFHDQWNNVEISSILESADPIRQFYTYWTRKESLIKADGRGLNLSLRQLDVSRNVSTVENTKWFFHALDIDKGYSCNLATENDVVTIETRHFSFS